MLGGEGTEQVYLQEAYLLAAVVKVLHGLLHAAGDGTHGHDDAIGIGRTIIIKEVILPTGELADLSHVVLHDVGELAVIAVVGLAELEVDVGVIHQRAHAGIFGVQSVGTEASQSVIVHQLCKIAVLQRLHLLDLMAGAEAVEEVQERDPRLDGGQVCHAGQIHDLLHAAGVQHGKTGLAAVHHVGVVAENGECVGAHGAGRHMQHAGQTLAGDAVHGGDHQHQALGGSEAGGQCAGFQCAVASAAGAGLRLHLHQADRLIENILLPFCRPFVRVLCHGRRRRNGVDRGDFGKRIGYICRRLVTITDLHDLTHFLSSSWAF